MSYGLEYGYPTVAARAQPDARAMFIRRTYGHLAGAILAFAALETVLVNLPNAKELVGGMIGSRAPWGIVLLAYMLLGWVADAWPRPPPSPPLHYLSLCPDVLPVALLRPPPPTSPTPP